MDGCVSLLTEPKYSESLDSELGLIQTHEMPPLCPSVHPTVIVASDPLLAARLSCALSKPNTYLAVLDGPRMTRHDHTSEVVRRTNAIARIQPDETLLAGLSDEARDAMMIALPSKHARVVTDEDALSRLVGHVVARLISSLNS